MFESRVQEAAVAVAALRACLDAADGHTQIEGLKAVEQLGRDLAHLRLALIAHLDRSGEFHQRCVTARAVFPTTLDGQPVEPVMPATATTLGALTIDQAHADIIETCSTPPPDAAWTPGVWGGAEAQLAEWAVTCRPDELRRLGTQPTVGNDPISP